MKKFIYPILTLFFAATALAQGVKISNLPLGSAATTQANDSFPYVASTTNTTKRLTVYDLSNVPTLVSTFAPKASPTFTGTSTFSGPVVFSSGIGVPGGGTGLTSITAHDLMIGNGISALTLLAPSSTSGIPLISQGASSNPAFGTAVIAGGGTGQVTASAAFNALSPMTTLGDVIYGGATGTGTRLAGNISLTNKFLTQTGTSSVSAAPAWAVILPGDLPTISLIGDVGGAAVGGTITTTLQATSNTSLASLDHAAGTVIHGIASNTAPAAGYVGEYVESIISSATSMTAASNAFQDCTSISLTAGDWDLYFIASYTSQAATSITGAVIGIGTVTGNNGAGLVFGSNEIETDYVVGLGTGQIISLTVPGYRVLINTTTSYFGKLAVTYATTAPKYQCRLSARRRR